MSTGDEREGLAREYDEWSDEDLFVRDVEGHLLRYDKATRAELDAKITIKIDGQDVTINKAVPATDDLGNFQYDADGEIIPRPTTIYDAVTKRYQKRDGDVSSSSPLEGGEPVAENAFQKIAREGKNPVPVLCHTPYMVPVAVCRVCVVELSQYKRSARQVQVAEKLLPACQHRVEKDMTVNTIASPDATSRQRVERSVKTLVELLMADHPSPCAKEQRRTGDCELEALAQRLELTAPRFEKRTAELPRDDTSLVIAVDHSACILCDRCVRGCDAIKKNHVIGRMGKGYTTRIAFDLDVPMGSSESSCVACGECGVSCPTGALTIKGTKATGPDGPTAGTGRRSRAKGSPGPFKLEGDSVTIDSLIHHERDEIRQAFENLARPFLQWNLDAIVRRKFRPGDIICQEGEYGRTAFMVESGSVEIFLKSPLGHVKNQTKRGLLGGIGQFAVGLMSRGNDHREQEDRRPFIPIDAPVALPFGKPVAPMGPGDIFGEMTCMNHYPRSATVVAVEECSVLEMLRNVLYIMQRNPFFRQSLGEKYRNRAIDNFLRSAPLFAHLRPSEREFNAMVGQLRGQSSPRHCDPGTVIFREGAAADDTMYLVRAGFVKVTKSGPNGDTLLNYVGPGGYIGEMAMLSKLPEFSDIATFKVRSANCIALDHVDLVPIDPADFHVMAPMFARERQFNDLVKRLRAQVSLRRCEPGELILRQGARATDGVYLVRSGFVKVSQSRPGGERVLNYVGPGGFIGEIGVLSDFPELRDLVTAGTRTATCTALDHVDLVRIDSDDFRDILTQFPAVRPVVIEEARRRLLSNARTLRDVEDTTLGAFLDQGLMNAEHLLVLDLEKCTRCDECTKACADTHQGVTRLIREGLRFDKFLVASSCRSCLDPYCLVGCPVGSISRNVGGEGEINIADWCIGCGLCAENCPYGNINMVEEFDRERKAEVRKATTCDLCKGLGPNHEPSCVYACPHDAAHRLKGSELLKLVQGKEA